MPHPPVPYALPSKPRSPIKWIGGKSRIRDAIIAQFPAHTCYVEVFGGAGWILFGKDRSKVEVFNDIDGELVNFFRIVRDDPEALIASFDLTLVSREEFDYLKNIDLTTLSDVERAHRFFYLVMSSWGGELGKARFQTSIRDGGHGNRLIGAIKRLRERIEPAYRRLQSVIIENLDWRECVVKYNREGVLMYLDPPYPGNKCNYAYNMRDVGDHEELISWMKDAKAIVLLSTYDRPAIRERVKPLYCMRLEFNSGMMSRNQELLVSNRILDGP